MRTTTRTTRPNAAFGIGAISIGAIGIGAFGIGAADSQLRREP
jgi:hypothetical protein